jgi:hypothetical protein
MRRKISRLQFIIVACAIMSLLLALLHISDLRLEQAEMLRNIEVLDAVREEYREVLKQVDYYHDLVNQLSERNDILEEILYNRNRSYRIVTEAQGQAGTNIGLLSRSGHAADAPAVPALNMPVRSSSGFSAFDFEHVWQVFQAVNLKGTGQTLFQAEEDYGVNALVLAAIIVHESAWGKSTIAVQKNNLAGLGAFDCSPYNSAITFSSKEDSIIFLAGLLDRDYLTPGGRHYNGIDLAAIGKRYATDPQWAVKVAAKMKLIVRTVME